MNYSICTDFEQHNYVRCMFSGELMSVISIKPRNDLQDTDQFTGTPL